MMERVHWNDKFWINGKIGMKDHVFSLVVCFQTKAGCCQ